MCLHFLTQNPNNRLSCQRAWAGRWTYTRKITSTRVYRGVYTLWLNTPSVDSRLGSARMSWKTDVYPKDNANSVQFRITVTNTVVNPATAIRHERHPSRLDFEHDGSAWDRHSHLSPLCPHRSDQCFFLVSGIPEFGNLFQNFFQNSRNSGIFVDQMMSF